MYIFIMYVACHVLTQEFYSSVGDFEKAMYHGGLAMKMAEVIDIYIYIYI